MKKKLMSLNNLEMTFNLSGKNKLHAVNQVSLDIYEGETIGIVGESGCGKTTLGRTITKLYDATGGELFYHGRDVIEMSPKYFVNDVKKFIQRSKEYKEITIKKLEAAKEAKNFPVDSEEYKNLMTKSENYRSKGKELSYLNAHVAGGLVLCEDIDKVGDLLLKTTKLNHKIAKSKNEYQSLLKKINKAEKALDESKTTNIRKNYELEKYNNFEQSILDKQQKLEERVNLLTEMKSAISAEIEQLENELSVFIKELQEMKNLVINDPNFEKLEERKCFYIDINRLTSKEMNTIRKDIQMIFQDPYSSLNPRSTIREIIKEGMLAHKIYDDKERYNTKVLELLEKVGLKKTHGSRFPHEFSGGQRQRIGIARTLAVKPKLIVCDEPTSALDVSIQAQIINLLKDLQAEFNLTYVFISHDLSVVKYISDRIAVMYLGEIVEIAPSSQIYNNPKHPYTKALLSAIPIPDYDIERSRERIRIDGDLPNPINLKKEGCSFYNRCPFKTDECKTRKMSLEEVAEGHYTVCQREE